MEWYIFMIRTFFAALTAAAALSLALSGCRTASPSSPDPSDDRKADSLRVLTIGTADSGGTMYPVGKAIAQAISQADGSITVNLSASGGSASNAAALQNGEIDLGLVSGDVAYAAVNGQEEFEASPCPDLRVIAAVYPSLSNWMAPSSLHISYVHELKGKRIAIGPQDSSTELSARIVLDAAGITEANSILKNYGLGSGSEGILSGSLDAVHGFAGIPISGFSQLADAMPCTVLRYTDQELDSILTENRFYYRDVIPAGTYPGQTRDVDTFGIKCLLCVDQAMDEALAYELTSILYENSGILEQEHPSLSAMSRDRFMYSAVPIPLHPGAERFYWEKGLLPETPGKME